MEDGRRRRFWTHTLPLLAYLGLITIGSHRSAPAPFPVPAPADKVAHLIEFLPLGILLGRWWEARSPGASGISCLVAVAVLGTLFAMADEVHQSFVPGRTADVLDVAADAVGVLAGGALWWGWRRWRPRGARRGGVSAPGKAQYTLREGR